MLRLLSFLKYQGDTKRFIGEIYVAYHQVFELLITTTPPAASFSCLAEIYLQANFAQHLLALKVGYDAVDFSIGDARVSELDLQPLVQDDSVKTKAAHTIISSW